MVYGIRQTPLLDDSLDLVYVLSVAQVNAAFRRGQSRMKAKLSLRVRYILFFLGFSQGPFSFVWVCFLLFIGLCSEVRNVGSLPKAETNWHPYTLPSLLLGKPLLGS